VLRKRQSRLALAALLKDDMLAAAEADSRDGLPGGRLLAVRANSSEARIGAPRHLSR